MFIFIALLIIGYTVAYSGFTNFATDGQGVTFFEALGVQSAKLTSALVTPPPSINTQPSTTGFLNQAAPVMGTPPNPGNVASV